VATPTADAETLRQLVLRSSRLAEANEWSAEALEVNRRLTELAPESAGAWWRLGICCQELRDLDAAQLAFSRVADLESDTSGRRAAETKLQQIEARKTASTCTRTEDALKEATAHRSSGALAAALIWSERAIDLAKTTSERTRALTEMAAALRGERELTRALELLREATEAQPDRRQNKAAFTVLVATLTDAGRLVQARDEAERLLTLFPNDPYVLNAAGRAYMSLYRKTGDADSQQRASSCFARDNRLGAN
jgi:tetratricopeptide (TPR) repeat protein